MSEEKSNTKVSNNLSAENKNNPSEEIDLLVLFNFIGSVFSRFFNRIKEVFKSLLSVFLVLLKVVVKYYVLIGIVMLLTGTGLYFLKKSAKPLYVSDLIIRQNYNSGNLLYSSIEKFNELSMTRSFEELSKELKLNVDKIASLKAFEVDHNMAESELIEKYNLYLLRRNDSIGQDSLSFEKYKKVYDFKNYPLQTIRVVSSDKDVFNSLENDLVNKIASNTFFVKEKEMQLGVLRDQLNAYKSTVDESKVLQDKYMEILEKYHTGNNKSGSVTDINLNVNKGNTRNEIPLTREYELFMNNQKLRIEIAKIQDTIRMKEDIVRVQKTFGVPALEKNTIKSNFWVIMLSIFGFVLFVLVIKEKDVLQYIKNYQVRRME